MLDVGCGSGRALNKLAVAFPNSRFTGYDFVGEAIANANTEAQLRKLNNIQFEVKDAATLDECDRYHGVATFDAIHDQARPDIVLQNIYKPLRPDGVYLMQDIPATKDVGANLEHPIAPLLYTISCMHCMTVSISLRRHGIGSDVGPRKSAANVE